MKWLFVCLILFHIALAHAGFVRSVVEYVTNFGKCFKVPESCPNSNIIYYLYTRSTQNSPQVLDASDVDSIKKAKFDHDAPLKVLIHGYTGHKDYAPNGELRRAYFHQGEYNVITVDWGALAESPCYIEATYNVQVVGRCTAAMLELVYANNDHVTLNRTHVIGFSLGAHVAGVLAASLTSGRLPRLTGLDAALPLFDKLFTKASEMLDPDDAMYVDAYHTNGGQKGRVTTFGTVDFYMNNAAYQPGCNCNNSCNHYRAVEYFADSINQQVDFYAFKCYSWYLLRNGYCSVNNTDQLVIMGEHVPFNLSGVYYSFTNDRPPFAIPAERFYDNVQREAERVDIDC